MTVSVIVGNIFQAPLTHTIAYSMAEDLLCRDGFSQVLNEKFNCINDLKKQDLKITEIGLLDMDRKYLAMITKQISFNEPTLSVFSQSVVNLRNKIELLGIKIVSYPIFSYKVDKISASFVIETFINIFNETEVIVYLWRSKRGTCNVNNSLFTTNVMLAGDSNMLRIINKPPNTRQGHIISGGNILSILYSLMYDPPKTKLYFMAGTNDLLQLHRDKFTRRQCLCKLRVIIRRLLKVLCNLTLNVTLLTIPPCPLLEDANSNVTVVDFNLCLKKNALVHKIPILDVYHVLNEKRSETMSKTDKLHLTKLGADVVRKLILQ